jgi:hypothetical protein
MSEQREHTNGVPLLPLSVAEAAKAPESPPDIALVLRSLPGQAAPFDVRLRRLLKACRRAYGFRVLGCSDIAPPGRQQARQDAQDGDSRSRAG